MNTINLNLYNALRKELNLTEEKSQNVAKAIQEAVTENFAEKEMATKNDIAAVRAEIAESKTDILKWFIGGFITIVIMLLGLFATIVLRR